MKKPTHRDLALQVLNRLEKQGLFLEEQLHSLFQTHDYLDDRDKAFVTQLVQGVLRWRRRLDWIIANSAAFPLKKIHPLVLNTLRLACFQIFFLDKIPESAAVNEAVRQVKRKRFFQHAAFVNGLLRNLCRSREKIVFPDKACDPILFLGVFYSYPEWLVRKWIVEYGPELCESLLAAGNEIPKTTLRVNSLKLSREELIARLAAEGVHAQPTVFSPMGVDLTGFRGRVAELSAFKAGWFQVQDQAAQVVGFLLDPKPYERILDLCAGLGGKTTHLAQLMNDCGLIVAVDRDQKKLMRQIQNNRRLDLKCIQPIHGDATHELPLAVSNSYDKILVDVPCSGLGVLARHPDAKWNRSEADLKRLPELQKAILHSAVSLLGTGGKILYATCTLDKEENEGVIDDFLKTHADFRLIDLRRQAPPWARTLINERGFLQTFPAIHAMDGFFAALLSRGNV